MTVSRRPGPVGPDPFSPALSAKTPGSTGLLDQADPNVEADHGDTPGSVGRGDGAAALVDARFRAGGSGKGQKRGSRKRPKRKTKVLNLVADFPNPWSSTAAEIEAIKKNAWTPSSDDFAALVSRSYTVKHFHQLIGLVVRQQKASVERVNIFTHSNPDLIAFSGTITPRSTFADVSLNTRSALSLDQLEKITSLTWFKVGKSKRTYTMQDVRARFTKNALVVFYSCKSAMDARLLQEFANKFHVTAMGFKEKICYCPTHTGNRINRKVIGIGSNCKHKGSDFTGIDRYGVSRRPKP